MADHPFYKDLKLTRRGFDEQVSDRDGVDLIRSVGGDLQTVDGRANLAQAIINRLLTRKGELARLGHPNYGSRLHQLIGELNNERIRGRAEIYIRESLAREPRIEKITYITIKTPGRGEDRSELVATIGVKPVGDQKDLTVSIPLILEG